MVFEDGVNRKNHAPSSPSIRAWPVSLEQGQVQAARKRLHPPLPGPRCVLPAPSEFDEPVIIEHLKSILSRQGSIFWREASCLSDPGGNVWNLDPGSPGKLLRDVSKMTAGK